MLSVAALTLILGCARETAVSLSWLELVIKTLANTGRVLGWFTSRALFFDEI